MNTQVNIGQVKRDIAELVNCVTYAGERLILTSRGKPKAALVNMQDYEKREPRRQFPEMAGRDPGVLHSYREKMRLTDRSRCYLGSLPLRS